MNFPDEISYEDPKFFESLENAPDTDIFHNIIDGLNWDIPDSLDIAIWIFSHPQCDAATAAGFLLSCCGLDACFTDIEKLFPQNEMLQNVVCTILVNAEKGFYKNTNLIIPHIASDEMAKLRIEYTEKNCIKNLGSVENALLPIPKSLFANGRGSREADWRYLADEVGVRKIEKKNWWIE